MQAEITLRDIIAGNCCQVIGSGTVIMKLKPTGFLLNSSVVVDVVNRNDYLVADIKKGTVYSMKGTVPVRRLISKMLYSTDTSIHG
jgi:hypothetical protein